jgi:hypothetical protein
MVNVICVVESGVNTIFHIFSLKMPIFWRPQ